MKVQRILFWGNFNRIEDIKLVKKIIDLNPIGVRTKRPTKNRWRDEVINDLKKLKLRNWNQILKDRRAWNDQVQGPKPM